MPELPEVETIRRQLEPLVVGSSIAEAWTFGTPKFDQATAAVGHRIDSIRRRGKYLIIGMSSNKELIIHLGMTGQLSVRDSAVRDSADHKAESFVALERPPHRRAEWRLEDGRVLEFTDIRRFGRVAVVEAGRYESLPTLFALGPEPFDESFTPEHLRQAVRSSRQAIKTQLMSQKVVAGLGNIYIDEALWLAKVNPAAVRLTRAQAAELRDAIRTVLQSGIDNRGTTLRDYRDASGSSGENQYGLKCYGRAGEPCLRCGGIVSRVVIGGRSTSFCPHCQRR